MDIILIALGSLSLVLAVALIITLKKNMFYTKKYSNIISIDEEVIKSQKEKEVIDTTITDLKQSYKEKKVIFDKLLKQVAIYDEEIELAELGFYKPHFDFDTSERYKEEITEVKLLQKEMISEKTAIYATTEWTVEGSKAKGRTMTNRGIRLTARAFNNECDSATSNVTWNNIERMEQRIIKAFEAINKLNESNHILIEYDYLELKIKELKLTHEYKEKKHDEKEEQAEIRRQMREEAKLQQEAEKAQKDEEKYQKLLDKANNEAEKASGEKLDKLKESIRVLSLDLEEAHAKNTRAKSMAQQTKSGHVYVISNIGSFGEDVYKIGMTRRLEPLDRVKELGDASVPFIFDVHAMIYSDDAPALENSLHKLFDSQRVNLVNSRKEFFKVTLDEIETQAKKTSNNVEFIKTAEAKDYTESKAIRMQLRNKADIKSELPEEL